jgi:putative transcriptional regulator
MKEKVINHIKEYRNRLELTQQELAKAVGVSRQTIISIERGRYVPSLPLALKFARFFSCPADELFERR